MADFRTLDDVDLRGKRVLLRVDLNVPMADGEVGDPTRVERMAPTVAEIAAKGGKVIPSRPPLTDGRCVMSWVGRLSWKGLTGSGGPLAVIACRDWEGLSQSCAGVAAG